MALSISFTAAARHALHFPRMRANFATAHVGPNGPDRHARELFLNHLWESLNSGAKVLFFAVLTPIMLSVWGSEKFGLFAVANSCVALMAFLDLGLRILTRVRLTSPEVSESAKVRVHALNIAAFSLAAGGGVGVVAILACTGCWHRWLNLPPTGDVVIVTAAALTVVLMWLQLLVERIASAGRLSLVKAALFVGNLLAFAIVFALLRRGETVAIVTSAYFAALAFPLLFLLPFADLRPRLLVRAFADLSRGEIFSALRAGGSINLITASWIFQSYGLVLLISWVIGPAAAGTFFLYLKLSELLSVLGASASEPTIAALAGAPKLSDRRSRFATAYKSAIALCLTGAIGYTFFGSDLFRLWLHRSLESPYTGLLIGLFGVVTGFNRMVTAASLGLGKPRPTAIGLLAGALTVAGSVIMSRGSGGPEFILAINCVAGLLVVPSAVIIARDLGSDFVETWLQPLARFAPGLAAIIVICGVASYSGYVSSILVAAAISTLICVRYLFQRSSQRPPARAINSLFGYDTRSWRSASIMRAVDLMNPFRRAEEFVWRGPCIISSTAGLGDLFIHLPLISGILKQARRRGIEARVALRPAHVVIGAACGWDVLPFDPALEDFFKNPFAIKPAKLIQQIGKARRTKCNLWIDLTGSAVSALSIKCAGARKIAARITRGGRSFVNHPLPHTLNENEYGNIGRVASILGCEPDYGVFDRLRGQPLPELEDTIVLCLTTVCRWRNWPLENFLALVDRFSEEQFVATGFSAEVAHEERGEFSTLLRRSNVKSLVDTMSVLGLVRLIAHARAVVTNDTSSAHIANAFRKPGAVLFGPASPDKLAAPYGVKSFADRTCPFHPCVQWTCRNKDDWCMRKIQVGPVADHLAAVIEATEAYAATARLASETPAIGSSSAIH